MKGEACIREVYKEAGIKAAQSVKNIYIRILNTKDAAEVDLKLD